MGVLCGNVQDDYPSNSGKPLVVVIPNQVLEINLRKGVETGWRTPTKNRRRDSPDYKSVDNTEQRKL